MSFHPLPKQAAPHDVVIPVKIPTTNTPGGKLQWPEHHRDSNGARNQQQIADGGFRANRTAQLSREFHLLGGYASTSQSLDKLKKDIGVDWLG